MSQTILSMSNWVSLPNEVRYKIRALFNIPRSGSTIVNDGRIETDGTTYKDFEDLTVAKMQVYLGDESTDFHKLFDKVVARVNDELIKPASINIPMASSPLPISPSSWAVNSMPVPPIPVQPKKRGRKPKVK